MEISDFYFIFIIAVVELAMFSYLISNMNKTKKMLDNYLALEKMRTIKQRQESIRMESLKMENEKLETSMMEEAKAEIKNIEPWDCIICDEMNTAGKNVCQRCGSDKY